ncbi:MAG: hypothetical protein ABJB33_01255 [Gemmatimonadota bacterium]
MRHGERAQRTSDEALVRSRVEVHGAKAVRLKLRIERRQRVYDLQDGKAKLTDLERAALRAMSDAPDTEHLHGFTRLVQPRPGHSGRLQASVGRAMNEAGRLFPMAPTSSEIGPIMFRIDSLGDVQVTRNPKYPAGTKGEEREIQEAIERVRRMARDLDAA